MRKRRISPWVGGEPAEETDGNDDCVEERPATTTEEPPKGSEASTNGHKG